MHTADVTGVSGGALRPHSNITQLLVERGNCLLEHTLVGGGRGAAEVLPGARARQFQRASALLDDTVLRRHCRPRALFLSGRLFLLGFYRLRFKTSSHAVIVRCPMLSAKEFGGIVDLTGCPQRPTIMEA